MSFRTDVGKRVGVALVVAGLVVLAAFAAGGVLVSDSAIPSGPDNDEYDPDDLAPQKLDAEGDPDPSGEVGKVVIDRAHNNRFDHEDLESLTTAITQAGGDVEFTDRGESIKGALSDADVYVVVDPGTGFEPPEVTAIEQFLNRGGRLVILGEPNRKGITSTGVAVQITTTRSQLTALASAFGFSFGTQYLYDLEHNDGNFKNVLAESAGDDALVDGVDRVALYTAASVDVDRGSVLLRTAPSAKADDTDRANGFPVAAVNADGNVLAVGDTGFLRGQRASVADNEALVARMVEFMSEADGDLRDGDGGEAGDGGEVGDGEAGDGEDDNESGDGNESESSLVAAASLAAAASSAGATSPLLGGFSAAVTAAPASTAASFRAVPVGRSG
jgi:hypothetical protein